MGAATLRQPASLRASDARGSERATRIEATRARVAAVGGVDRGKNPHARQRSLPRCGERGAGEGCGSTYPSMAHRGHPRGTERRRRNSRNRLNGSEL